MDARGLAAAAWGIAGPCALLGAAVWRLAPVALEALRGHKLSAASGAAAAAWIAAMAYLEGYRGFQRGFAPRVVARALRLAQAPRLLHALLAPLFCMGLLHATRRRLVSSWCLTIGVIALVALVRRLGQPARGLIDAGVVIGLGWGLVAIAAYTVRALAGAPPPTPADLPD